jgi:hypothetical protein
MIETFQGRDRGCTLPGCMHRKSNWLARQTDCGCTAYTDKRQKQQLQAQGNVAGSRAYPEVKAQGHDPSQMGATYPRTRKLSRAQFTAGEVLLPMMLAEVLISSLQFRIRSGADSLQPIAVTHFAIASVQGHDSEHR